eukprot:SAG22_NODE_1946_length_3279_cov_1.645283_2_plen_110_part_00
MTARPRAVAAVGRQLAIGVPTPPREVRPRRELHSSLAPLAGRRLRVRVAPPTGCCYCCCCCCCCRGDPSVVDLGGGDIAVEQAGDGVPDLLRAGHFFSSQETDVLISEF